MIEILNGAQLFTQQQAAEAEVEALCGSNSWLVEDHVIGTVVEFAANGRHTFVHDLQSSSPVEAGGYARILPAHRSFGARRVQEPDCDREGVYTMCDRCSGYHNSSKGRRLLVPAGSAAIEFVVCPSCVDYLDLNYGPVTWRS